jgi:hypothetical protein
LLKEYGLIAWAFHTTVWATSLFTTFFVLSLGPSVVKRLEASAAALHLAWLRGEEIGGIGIAVPEWLADGASAVARVVVHAEAAPESAGGGTGVIGRLAASLAVVEVFAPLRFGLTVAATPAISAAARRFAAVRDAEAAVGGLLTRLTRQLAVALSGRRKEGTLQAPVLPHKNGTTGASRDKARTVSPTFAERRKRAK